MSPLYNQPEISVMRKFPLMACRSVALASASLWLAACSTLSGGPTAKPEFPVVDTGRCANAAEIAALASAYEARIPADNPDAGQSVADAACARAKFQVPLAKQLGPAVGYKAGLTNPAVQKRFNASEPVWGVLRERMLLKDGATVMGKFGSRPMFEADMVVRVKSAAINQATTPAQVLANIEQIVPFMELPDLVVQDPTKLDGNALAAVNVGARLGVMGQPIEVPANAAQRDRMLAELADMSVRLVDADGKELAKGKGSDVMGHPLNAVVWLASALQREGLALRPGQLVSLGSFSPLLPPKAGQRVSAHYDGLTGAQPVSVQFE